MPARSRPHRAIRSSPSPIQRASRSGRPLRRRCSTAARKKSGSFCAPMRPTATTRFGSRCSSIASAGTRATFGTWMTRADAACQLRRCRCAPPRASRRRSCRCCGRAARSASADREPDAPATGRGARTRSSAGCRRVGGRGGVRSAVRTKNPAYDECACTTSGSHGHDTAADRAARGARSRGQHADAREALLVLGGELRRGGRRAAGGVRCSGVAATNCSTAARTPAPQLSTTCSTTTRSPGPVGAPPSCAVDTVISRPRPLRRRRARCAAG